MKCLIIAAGRGSRLREVGSYKPMTPVLGVPLIERVIRCAMEAQIREFYVVSGYNGEELRAFLDGLASELSIKLIHVRNDMWERGNGLSVLAAKAQLSEHFVLLMADHLFDPSILKGLISEGAPDGRAATMVVDTDLSNPFVDRDDVTKVFIEDGKVVEIGKDLHRYNAFDTGIFLCAPQIFKALEEEADRNHYVTLTDGVRNLAKRGQVRAWRLREGYWIDVDDSKALKDAERLLLRTLPYKVNDGPVSRHLNRMMSRPISAVLARKRVPPNAISMGAFMICLVSAVTIAIGSYVALAMGGVLAQLASIIDGCDGEVARLTYNQSDYGGWLDAVLDRYADGILILSLSWHAQLMGVGGVAWWLGGLALLGSFMTSYTADKYDFMMRLKGGDPFRIGRDVRLFIIFLGAIMDAVLVTLGLLAVTMNLEVARRIILYRSR